MMSDDQYYKYIEKMVKESLDVQFDSIMSSKSDLDCENKNTIATLIANSALLSNIIYNLKEWSYNQAEQNYFERSPRMASFFLSPIIVRSYTMQYVNYITQGKKQIMEGQTR